MPLPAGKENRTPGRPESRSVDESLESVDTLLEQIASLKLQLAEKEVMQSKLMTDIDSLKHLLYISAKLL